MLQNTLMNSHCRKENQMTHFYSKFTKKFGYLIELTLIKTNVNQILNWLSVETNVNYF